MTNEEKDKKEYELALLLKTEEDLAGILTLVGQHKGENPTEPRAKRLGLAYEIKKNTEAVFVYFTFKGYGDDIKNLETDLNQRQEVIRFLIIASPAPAERSVVMPPHERRGGGSRPPRTSAPSSEAAREPREARPASTGPLSNEALEKKIEEILK